MWHDEEDEDLEVDLTQTNRLKKLRKSDSDPTVITSDAFSSALQERYTIKLQLAYIHTMNLLM